jgi:hypothetical protein
VERVGGEEALDAVFESGIWSRGRWGWQLRRRAANGKRCRIGEIIFLVGSDTVVPEDLFEGCDEGDGGVSDGQHEFGEDRPCLLY